MRRKIWIGSAVLLAIAAVEFGLLGAGAAGITGRHDPRVNPGIVPAVTATPASPPSAPGTSVHTDNTYEIDADPNTPGIQDAISVPVGSTFRFYTVITQAPDAYEAEQVSVAFNPVIAYVSGPVNHILGQQGLCAPGVADATHVFGGCIGSSQKDTGVTFEWAMTCLSDGSTALHFQTGSDVLEAIATTFVLANGVIADPVVHDATVICGSGTPGPATPTATATSQVGCAGIPSSPPCPPTVVSPPPVNCSPMGPPDQISPPGVSPPTASCDEPFRIEISADPLEIVCNGQRTSLITVHVRNRNGGDVPNGTPVYLENRWGGLSDHAPVTYGGTAVAFAWAGPVPYASLENFTIDISVGRLQASFRVLCAPGPISPPPCVLDRSDSPPSSSPPCATPTPPCPPYGVSGPGSASPPCATPTPECIPAGVSVPGSVSPPCAAGGGNQATPTSTPTAVPTSTSTATPTAVPTSTSTPVREVCGDVTGDGRVTIVDVLRESAMTRVPHAAARYDLNGDGRVDEKDVATVARQVGRQC